MPILDHDTKLKICESMRKYGGPFAKCLSELLIMADAENQEKIENAWWNYIDLFAGLAKVEIPERKPSLPDYVELQHEQEYDHGI